MYENFGYLSFSGREITDISKKIKIITMNDTTGTPIYTEHIIQEWESPENIAYDYYGSCDEVWAVLAINEVVNPFFDWLMRPEELSNYVVSKYGEDNVYSVHHYELNGVSSFTPFKNAVAISNFEYENDRNELKRKIKVIRPELLSQIKEKILEML